MNNADLDRMLKSAAVPERLPEFWECLPKRVSTRLHWQQYQKEINNLPSRHRAGLIWGWGIAGATVLALLGFLIGYRHGNPRTTALLQNEKLLREVLATFPNQVQAIIQDENGLHLSLAEEANVPQSQPLWIKVCKGETCRNIITFSGQVMQIADQRVEVLVDARGGVILAGEHFYWSSEQGIVGAQMQIRAQQLHYAL